MLKCLNDRARDLFAHRVRLQTPVNLGCIEIPLPVLGRMVSLS